MPLQTRLIQVSKNLHSLTPQSLCVLRPQDLWTLGRYRGTGASQGALKLGEDSVSCAQLHAFLLPIASYYSLPL